MRVQVPPWAPILIRNHMKERTFNTLFMLSSLDGKISTGSNDKLDFDKDLPKIKGAKEGLSQYYEIEKTTDTCSLNSGKVWAKIGINKKIKITEIPVNFILIDNKPHLTMQGIKNAIAKGKKLFLVTTNKNHPAFNIDSKKLEIIYYPKKINFKNLFSKLYKKYNLKRITIQTGGTLNSIFLRENLIDMVSLVIAPALVGGKNTSSLIDGESLKNTRELNKIKSLKLIKINKLKNSYIHLKYRVKN